MEEKKVPFRHEMYRLESIFHEYMTLVGDRTRQGHQLIMAHQQALMSIMNYISKLVNRIEECPIPPKEISLDEPPKKPPEIKPITLEDCNDLPMLSVPEFCRRYPICKYTYLNSVLHEDIGTKIAAIREGPHFRVHPYKLLFYMATARKFGKIKIKILEQLRRIMPREEYDKHFNRSSY